MLNFLIFVSAVLVALSNANDHHSVSSSVGDWKYPIEKSVEECLAGITDKSINVIIDISFMKFKQTNSNHPWYQAKPKPNPLTADVSYFTDDIVNSIPRENFYAIIYDNQTRYYLTVPPADPITTTTLAPNHGHRHHPSMPSMRTVLKQFFISHATGNVQDVPTSKPLFAKPTAFTVVVTDGTRLTPLTAYPNPSSSVIIDIGGVFSITNKPYPIRNVLLARKASYLDDLVDTVRLQICQAAGGLK